ncbi:unnamed protein product [Rotaria socialis]|nr:unnamed protein product [Rotaria socialis]CAF3613874.1 unnamed protein product [Rotaria socialis]
MDSKPIFAIGTLKEFPQFKDYTSEFMNNAWPTFFGRFTGDEELYSILYTEWIEYQVVCFDPSKNKPLGYGFVVPIHYDGNLDKLPDGWNNAILQALDDYSSKKNPTALNGMAIIVDPDAQKQGISLEIIKKITDICRQHNFHSFIVNVRPILKHQYPLIPLEKYAHWTIPTGEPFDPWIRTHVRAGGEIAHVSSDAVVIKGTIDQWQTWTGLSFQDSGEYIVKGALVPITIDLENNIGIYREPNIWIIHTINPNSTSS